MRLFSVLSAFGLILAINAFAQEPITPKELSQNQKRILISFDHGNFIGAPVFDKDDNAYLIGVAENKVSHRDFILKLKADGSIDESFGKSGFVSTFLIPTDAKTKKINVYRIDVQPDGRVIFVGEYHNNKTKSLTSFIGRLDAQGQPDSSFGAGGITELDEFGTYHPFVQRDGSLLVLGQSQLKMIKLSADGKLDKSFGKNGSLNVADIDPYFKDKRTSTFSSFQQNDDRLILTALVSEDRTERNYCFRLNIDGTIDHAFGDRNTINGAMRIPPYQVISSYPDIHLAILPSGKIIILESDLNVTRLEMHDLDGKIDTQFGNNGKATVDLPPVSDNSVEIFGTLKDGSILLGRMMDWNGAKRSLLRINGDGAVDTRFKAPDLFNDKDDYYIRFVTPLPDGKHLLVGGWRRDESAIVLERSDIN